MLLALAGGGVIAYIFFTQNQQHQVAPATPASFINLDPIQVPITEGGVTQTRTYYLTVESREGAAHRTVQQQDKKLRDLYMTVLSALSTRAGPENLENTDYTKEQLKLASERVVGPNVVYGVLIRNVLSRP